MALTLIATAGAIDANAYIDRTGAKLIIAATPNSDAWDNADQSQALVYATTMLEALAYQGLRTTARQSLQWPRAWVNDPDSGLSSDSELVTGGYGIYLDSLTIPRRVQRACVMLALEIARAGTADIWGVDETSNIRRKRVDVLETEYAPARERKLGLRKFPSVWREVFPLMLAVQPQTVERS